MDHRLFRTRSNSHACSGASARHCFDHTSSAAHASTVIHGGRPAPGRRAARRTACGAQTYLWYRCLKGQAQSYWPIRLSHFHDNGGSRRRVFAWSLRSGWRAARGRAASYPLKICLRRWHRNAQGRRIFIKQYFLLIFDDFTGIHNEK